MDFISGAIKKPVTTSVAVILVVMFGIIGMMKLPVQLAPDTELPEIEVRTVWYGASPTELESEVVEKQEDKLKSLQSLQKMESSSYNDYATVTLTFDLSTEIDTALLRVANKLDEVSSYPDNVLRPTLSSSGGSSSPIIWMQMKMKSGPDKEILKYRTFFENDVKQYLERIEGVASLLVFGGTEDQLEIVLDPEKLARQGVTINQVIAKVVAANRDISAGVLGIDRKNYRIRTVAKFQNDQDPMDVVIFDDGIKRVYLRDVAESRIGYEPQFVSVMENGSEGIVIGVKRQKGGNVIEIVKRVRQEVDRLNRDVLAPRNLYINWSYDQAPYIQKAIKNMKINVAIGASLAIMVLLLFFGSIRATITIGLAIPVSAVGTFIFLWLFHRNLNVVSLAGISFAVGMLVDNSIVVMENIDRHLRLGEKVYDAVNKGAKEVYGAVVASTLTTVAVFLPVIFIRQEAGQLFRDIAIAITSSILLSLIVSVTVIPSFMHFIYKKSGYNAKGEDRAINRAGRFFVNTIMALSAWFQKNKITRLGCVIGFTAFSIFMAVALIPKAEYLPQGNQNFIMSILVPPPGYSAAKRQEVGEYIFHETDKYRQEGYEGLPQIKNVFYVAADMISLFGVVATEKYETATKDLIPSMNRIINSMPGMFGVTIQPGIFESGIGKGRTIDLNISGENMDQIVQAGQVLFGAVSGAVPGSQIRPVPSLEISYPEGRVVPDKSKLAASGLSESELGIYVDVLMDGRKVSDFGPEGKDQIDLVVRGKKDDFKTPEDILNTSLVNNFGQMVRIGDVASIKYAKGMTQIDRLEKKRNIRLEITPPESIALQSAIEIVQKTVDDLIEAGTIKDVQIKMGGNANKLTETFNALKWNLLLALLITYLLMASLFENFLYPLIIMFSVPLAAAGGFIGLRLVDLFIAPQPLDVLTMLGFIILIGTVVNNAILIVHQTLSNIRTGQMEGMAAISEAVNTRIRPIFMSACTSIFGLLPLVVSTGSGSELYRGIGSVLLGGLGLSTMFTLFVIPALLSFFIGLEKSNSALVKKKSIVLTLAIVFISSSVGAVTLEELQNYAISGRDLIKLQEAALDIRKEQVIQKKGAFFPSVDLGYSMKRLDDETSLGEEKKGDTFQGGISLNLFAGMGDYYNLKAARKMEASGQFDLKSVKQDILFNVALKYLDLYRSIEKFKVTEDASRLYKDRFRHIEMKYKVGILKKSDLLRVKVELDNAVQDERKARARVKAALNFLSLETGEELIQDEMNFSLFDILPQAANYENYEILLLQNRSEINAMKQTIAAAEMKVKASKAANYPRADFLLHYNSYNRNDYFYASPEANEEEIRAQAVITLNLFNGMKSCAKTKETKLEKMKIRYSLKELENSLKTLLKNTILDSDVAFDNLELAKSGKEEAEENLRVTDIAFAQGLSTSSDVLDAIFNLARSRFNLIAAYTEIFENQFRLQRLVETF